jgi:hypothetical protein
VTWLGQRGAVRLRHRLLDQGQHVALPDRLPKAREPVLWSDDAAAVDALHQAGPVRVGDDASDQAHRLLRLLRLREGGAHVEQALAWLRHEHRAVGQAAQGVARREGGLGGLRPMVMPFMGEGIGRRDNEHDERQARHGHQLPAAPGHQAEQEAECKRDAGDHVGRGHLDAAEPHGRSVLQDLKRGAARRGGSRGNGLARQLERADQQVVSSRRGDSEDEFQRAFARELGRGHRIGAVGGGLGLDLLVATDGHGDPGVGHRLVRGEPVQVEPKTVAAEDADELVGIRLRGDPWVVGGNRGGRWGAVVMPLMGNRRGGDGG